MSKLRVLFVAGLTPTSDGLAGGQGTVAQALYRSRLQAEVEFDVLSTTMQSLPPPPLPIRALAALKRTLKFAMRVRSNDVALIFSSDGFSLIEKSVMCMIARAMGIGVVLRTSAGGLRPQVERSGLIRWFFRKALKRAHVVCSQGKTWTAFFEEFPEAFGKVLEVPNAVGLPAYRRDPAMSRQIMYVGWMIAAKGIYDLVQVFAKVHERFPDAALHVVGGGGEAEGFAEAVRAAGLSESVRIHGWLPREKVFTLFHESAVLVLPSHSEGLPNVVLEAMAAGTPVVTTRVGSLPDVIHEGENGFLAQPGDVAKMAEDIVGLLAEPDTAYRIAAAARQTAQQFSIEKVWPKYQEILTRAAQAAGRRVVSGSAETMRAQSAKG
jgi:glycosyltransferase involved in cell wall biosynthesis